MVGAELAPFARETEAADAVAGLGKALRQLGHRVTLALPRYPAFEAGGLLVARRLTPLSLPTGAEVTVLDGQLASGVELVLFDAPALFDRAGVFGDGAEYPDNLARFSFLAQAAAALARQRLELGKNVDVVHLHDWPAALVPYWLKQAGVSVPTLLTVHDARCQGAFAGAGDETALPSEARLADGSINLLCAGVATANMVITVSNRYAEEMRDPALTGPLASALEKLQRPLVGVPYGVDYALYNPATDPAIESRYDAEDASNKARCKTTVLRRFEFELDIERPLCIAVGRLDHDSGADLLAAALPDLLKNDVALVVAGKGAQELVERVAQAGEYAGDLAFLENPDEPMLHRLYAAADIVLIPSRHEPCGVKQLLAYRYGALPVARAVGGLCDTIVDLDAELETGTGFLFDEDGAQGLLGAFARAIAAYASPRWPKLVRRVMRLDVGWDRPARRHVQLYRELVHAGEGVKRG